MGKALQLTTANFDATVNEGVTLVDFWAEWCGPCKMIAPLVDELAGEYAGKAKVGKINVDDESDLAVRYNVGSIPTLLVMKDGQVAKQFIGVTRKADLAAAIDAASK
ncbi:MAG: thioredoxin [Candidatus Hydrogenedentota bacterium]